MRCVGGGEEGGRERREKERRREWCPSRAVLTGGIGVMGERIVWE